MNDENKEIINNNTEEQKKGLKHIDRKKLIIIGIIAAIIAIALILVTVAYPKYVLNSMDVAYENYNKDAIEYDAAYEKIKKNSESNNDTVKKAADTKLTMLKKIKNSHESYHVGISHLENKEYTEAIESLSKVVKEDFYYPSAQEKLTGNMENFKTETFNLVYKLEQESQYQEAIDVINNYWKYSEVKDGKLKVTELREKQNAKEKAELEKKITELKEKNLFPVKKAYAYNDGYYIVLMEGRVIVENKSDKVAKTVYLSILQFDNNGYPVDVEYSIYGEGNNLSAKMASVNIEPGKSFGHNAYYSLPDRVSKIKACVKSVEFIDGSTWTNEYYPYWLAEEKDRY